ncbi:hypothetical protein [Primorskyibacter marinus]|uniref:hypothetical protein n=1 Tax=Primorskyibacter marinus TaxID=1977320 RepID=UPI0013009A82|nr:hypothetical protein [Primorskyibacter marinus]
MTNALGAIVAAGLTPAALSIGPDGSFRVEVINGSVGEIEQSTAANENQPEKFEDLQ